jgi:hypothetical protein
MQPDVKGAGPQVDLADLQVDQRPQANPGAQQQFEDQPVPTSQRPVDPRQNLTQSANF